MDLGGAQQSLKSAEYGFTRFCAHCNFQVISDTLSFCPDIRSETSFCPSSKNGGFEHTTSVSFCRARGATSPLSHCPGESSPPVVPDIPPITFTSQYSDEIENI